MTGNEQVPASPRTLSRDTSPWAERILLDHWRRMEPSQKADLVADLSAALQRLSLAGLAARFPAESPEELARRSARIRLGPELCRIFLGAETDG